MMPILKSHCKISECMARTHTTWNRRNSNAQCARTISLWYSQMPFSFRLCWRAQLVWAVERQSTSYTIAMLCQWRVCIELRGARQKFLRWRTANIIPLTFACWKSMKKTIRCRCKVARPVDWRCCDVAEQMAWGCFSISLRHWNIWKSAAETSWLQTALPDHHIC